MGITEQQRYYIQMVLCVYQLNWSENDMPHTLECLMHEWLSKCMQYVLAQKFSEW